MPITIKKGLDIPIAGAPAAVIEPGSPVRSVAILGNDYNGLKPKLLVEPGAAVKLGQPLFVDKRDPQVQFTAPGSGTISAINRGARRALLSIVIDLDDAANDGQQCADPAAVVAGSRTVEDIRTALYASGLWTAFRTRPFNKVPQSASTPQAIFVTAIDTQPLSADPELVVARQPEAFGAGLQVIARLTSGNVHVCTGPDWSLPVDENEQIKHSRFSGPHPAGLPGTHIHCLNPVGINNAVWHIGCQDVIAIGKLFSEGVIWTERTVALGGAGFTKPRLVTTRLGANIEDLVAGELQPGTSWKQRLISGSVLAGRTVTGAEGYLGRYHLQVSAIADSSKRKLFGWLGLLDRNYSFSSPLARRQGYSSAHEFSTAAFGRPTALVAIDAFERVIPMDILAVPLLRSLLIRDTDQAQALGCLELDAEDLALCSFVCPGKNDYGRALAINLEQIEKDG